MRRWAKVVLVGLGSFLVAIPLFVLLPAEVGPGSTAAPTFVDQRTPDPDGAPDGSGQPQVRPPESKPVVRISLGGDPDRESRDGKDDGKGDGKDESDESDESDEWDDWEEWDDDGWDAWSDKPEKKGKGKGG